MHAADLRLFAQVPHAKVRRTEQSSGSTAEWPRSQATVPDDVFRGVLSRALSHSQSPVEAPAISPVKAEPLESPVGTGMAAPAAPAAAEDEAAWAPLPGAADDPLHQSIYGAWDDDDEEVGI